MGKAGGEPGFGGDIVELSDFDCPSSEHLAPMGE